MKRIYYVMGPSTARSFADWELESEAELFLLNTKQVNLYVNTASFIYAAMCLVAELKCPPFIFCFEEREYEIHPDKGIIGWCNNHILDCSLVFSRRVLIARDKREDRFSNRGVLV